jgi:dethiobiotin synthetase
MARLVVVTGTGTGIGKTHLTEALLRRLAADGVARVAGIKPVESGVGDGVSDRARLEASSTFHVKHRSQALRAPISPHLAARLEGLRLDVTALARDARAASETVDALLVELPGGLFTPLTDSALNADLAAQLEPAYQLLVAPDRLGVLHETLATLRAAAACGLRVSGVALVAPEIPDASTGTNAAELARYTGVPVLATVPRGTVAELADHPALRIIAQAVRR